jgi:hypothetical protein
MHTGKKLGRARGRSARIARQSAARLNRLATMPAQALAMTHGGFDATITLNDHHIATACLTDRPAEDVVAVRRAVERMDGAGWINVEAQSFPSHILGWVTLYVAGHGVPPDTSEWRALQRTVQRMATTAVPF